MQSRRGFLRTIFGAAVGVATGGLEKVAVALTSKKVVAACYGKSILDAGYFYAPYIPLCATPILDPKPFAKSKVADRMVWKEYYGGEILGKI